MSGALQNKEERMNTLLTIAELQQRTESDLRALFRLASQALARSDAGTQERLNSLATLENISRALALAPGARGV